MQLAGSYAIQTPIGRLRKISSAERGPSILLAMPLSAVIVDDEPLARRELHYLLGRVGDVSVVAEATNGDVQM